MSQDDIRNADLAPQRERVSPCGDLESSRLEHVKKLITAIQANPRLAEAWYAFKHPQAPPCRKLGSAGR